MFDALVRARKILLVVGILSLAAVPSFAKTVNCAGTCTKPACCDDEPAMGDTVNLTQSHSYGECKATLTVTQATQTSVIGDASSISGCTFCANVDVDGSAVIFSYAKVCSIPTLPAAGLLLLAGLLALAGFAVVRRRRANSGA